MLWEEAFEKFRSENREVFHKHEWMNTRIREAFQIVAEALNRFSIYDLALSWNGGKDATVVFHLVRLALQSFGKEISRLTALCISLEQEEYFPEIKEFTERTASKFGVEYVEIRSRSIKEGLVEFSDQHKNIKAIFMGTRNTDPGGANLQEFSRCDTHRGWPDLVRVNPILNWEYYQVWQFLHGFHIQYCELYDQGYTSIGSRNHTTPNPALRRQDGGYDPACFLGDSSSERTGRE